MSEQPVMLQVYEMDWTRELAEDEWWFVDYAKALMPNCTCSVLRRRDSLRGTEFFCKGSEMGEARRRALEDQLRRKP